MTQIINGLFNIVGLEIRRTIQAGDNSRPKNAIDDDFNWNTYRQHYENELRELEKEYTAKLAPGDYALDGGQLKTTRSIKPLHPNHRLLYETILKLNPHSLCEIGCGGGDHLHNLSVLMPSLNLRGFDRSARQLALATERSPILKGKVAELDVTLPLSHRIPQVDLAYTQAVVMHIQTGNGHLVALSNLFRLATKQVVLMENWSKHEFEADIRFLFDRQMIPWQDIHFYICRAPELANKPHLMVVSASPIELEPLSSYAQLADGIAK